MIIEKIWLQLSQFLVLIAFALLVQANYAGADSRQDAEAAVSRLLKEDATDRFPEEMITLSDVYGVALRHVQNDDQDSAEKYFQMVLQKARIIETKIKGEPELRPLTTLGPPVEETAPASVPVPDAVVEETAPTVPPVPAPPAVRPVVRSTGRLIGAKGVYVVVKSDTIRTVAAKLGVSQSHLRRMNRLDPKAILQTGQRLAYDNRKIVPQQVKDGIIVNIPDRTLYYFQQGSLVASLPVALGSVVKNEKYVWQTPVGKFKITAKLKDPTWTVPSSIQSEMEEQGKDVITSIPPGPENPLGKYAMKTSIPGILIHSTTRPGSIYSFSSHGCIRVSPSRMEEFFPQVKVNTSGEIIYKPVKLAVTEAGRIFLEVHEDVYRTGADIGAEARQMVEKQKLTGMVNWGKFNAVIKQKRGVVEDISL